MTTLEDLMAQLSVDLRNVHVIDDTLVANARVGDEAATVARCVQRRNWTGLGEIVARPPQGWDTGLGEGGSRLSGGERSASPSHERC
jgi:ATP-binding cassette subfamily B protein